MYIARQATNIQSDIKRNWSSWNFGQEGLNCDVETLEMWKQEAIDNDAPFYISGFELWGSDIENADIRELYDGYWVLVDDRFTHSIAGTELTSDNLDDAIIEMKSADFWGDGVRIDCTEAKLVYSEGDYHIFYLD